MPIKFLNIPHFSNNEEHTLRR